MIWTPTHVADGELVMLLPNVDRLDEWSAQPAYTADEWAVEGSTAQIRRRTDGAWLRWSGGELTGSWEDITARVTEYAITDPGGQA